MNFLSRFSRQFIGLMAAGTFFTLSMAASTYIVKGVVAESGTNTPCPGVIVRIYAENDSILPIITNLTDSLGRFEEELDTAGRYKVRTEFFGTKAEEKTFEVSDNNPIVELETIITSSSTETLEELVVSAKKPLVENDGATLTYNMSEDPESKGNTILEMLRKVPMVTVDADENIKVRGSNNFKIYLNGREDPMLSGDAKTILKAMPAANIKKVEVITEPGAKYEAEGIGGILNIVTTTKQNLDGVVGNVNVWLNTSNTGQSAYVRTKVGKVTGSANFYNNNSLFPAFCGNSNENIVENYLSEKERTIETKGKSRYNFWSTGGGLSLSWEPDTMTLVTFDASVGNNSSNSINTQTMESYTADKMLNWKLNRQYKGKNKNFYTNVGASYQHTIGKEGHYIVASYQYGFNQGGYDSKMETSDVEGEVPYSPWRRNENASHMNQHTFQIDYANPLGDHNVIEAGGKATWYRNNNMSAPWYGSSSEEMTVNESEQVSMAQFRHIQALYVSHTGNYGKWATRVGLRFERAETGIDYFSGPYDNFSNISNDLVPNLSATFRLTGMQNFRLAYQMRISRPGIYVLNPYINTMTQGSVSYGNPDLDSEHNHMVNLSYNNYGGKLGGSVKVGYSYTGNGIESYSFSEGDLVHETYANIGKSTSVSLSGDIQYTILPDLTFSANGMVQRTKYKADTEVLKRSKTGWSWNYYAGLNYRLPGKISLSAYGGQGSGWFNLESKGEGYHFYGISISRGFLKDEQLRINMYVQDFFEPKKTYYSLSQGDNTYTYSTSSYRNIHAGFSVSWQFGKLKDDVKRTGARIEADSEAGGSGNQR